MVPWVNASLHPLRLHLNRFSRICSAHDRHRHTPSITKRTSKCADAGAFKQFGRVALVIFKFLEIAVDHVGVPVESSVAGCRRLLDRRHLARPTSAPATFTTRHQNKPRHGTLQSHHAFSALTLLVERKEENPAV